MMNKDRIVVLGSTNIDMVIKTKRIPLPGETVLGGSFFMNSGGKGANQAVAIARLGGKVNFISKVGNDVFGEQAIKHFQGEGMDVGFLLTDPEAPTGVALITVDEEGENSIVVASGANGKLTSAEVLTKLKKMPDAGILLIQLEIPWETVEVAVHYASSNGIKVMLNPAPADPVKPSLFRFLDIITPNAKEAETLTGVKVVDEKTAQEAAVLLQKQGVRDVVVTLGEKGAVCTQGEKFHALPAAKVKAIDTTAAGDVFNGAFALALSEGNDFLAALQFAARAAAISTTRMGAQSSIPYRHELNNF